MKTWHAVAFRIVTARGRAGEPVQRRFLVGCPTQPAPRNNAPVDSVCGRKQPWSPVAARHPQMVCAIGTIGLRLAAAEQHSDLVHLAERPAAAAVVKFEDRAGHRAIEGGRRPGCYRRRPFRPRLRRLHLLFLDRIARQHALVAQPFHLAMIADLGRCNCLAICEADELGHRVISSRVSVSVQSMAASIGTPQHSCNARRSRRHFGGPAPTC